MFHFILVQYYLITYATLSLFGRAAWKQSKTYFELSEEIVVPTVLLIVSVKQIIVSRAWTRKFKKKLTFESSKVVLYRAPI